LASDASCDSLLDWPEVRVGSSLGQMTDCANSRKKKNRPLAASGLSVDIRSEDGMNTLQSVVDATTRFVLCQYPMQQNSGCDLIIVINLSLRFDFARSVDKPPGKTLSHLFVPRCPSFDPHRVFPSCTCVDEFRPPLTRAPPLRQASWMYGYQPLPGRIAPREGLKPYIRRPTRPLLRAFERRPP